MTPSDSTRQMLRSSVIVGGASVINILAGLLRIKAAAVLLGPAGVGLIGLLTSLVSTASALAGLGFGTAGTRQIAEASAANDAQALATARRALFLGTVVLAGAGAAVVWALRSELAALLLGDVSLAGEVGWLAIGVALTVAAVSQTAVLTGLRRTADIARVSIFAAMIATVVAVASLLAWGSAGIVVFVLAMPLGSVVAGYAYVARLPRAAAHTPQLRDLSVQWRALTALGTAFMIGGLASTLGQLAVRSLVQRELGPQDLGYFQAAATLSMTYLGFVLAAMAADYYPRLTACIKDPAAANHLINEQTELALLLAGPVLLTTMGLAPWIIEILYSSSFYPAADVLRWYVLGDVLKVASWPLGFAILASGSGRTFMFTEAAGMGVFVFFTWVGLPAMGVSAAGVAYACMYSTYLIIAYWLVKRKTGFRWTRRCGVHAGVLVLGAAAVLLLQTHSPTAGIIAALLAAVLWAIHALRRLSTLDAIGGPVGRLVKSLTRQQGKSGRGQ